MKPSFRFRLLTTGPPPHDIVDFGRAVAGKPFFEIEAVDGYAQIEVKVTESYIGLENPHGDGPFPFANGLGATFRVETFNITKTGQHRGFFIYGSQRWQSIRLVGGSSGSGRGGLTISRAGYVSSISEQPADTYDGYFASSNETYTEIWGLRLRTEQLAC